MFSNLNLHHWPSLGLWARKLGAGRPEWRKPRRRGRRGAPEAMRRKVHPNWQVLFVETGRRGGVDCCWGEFLKSCKGFVAASSLFRWNRPWQRVVLVVPNLISAVYSIWAEGASKINQGTKPNTHQPFKLHLFKAEPLVSPICYLVKVWMNPGAITPKNSPIYSRHQPIQRWLSVHPPTGAGASHNSPNPGLLGTCPCRTPGPLAFGAAGHRWGPQGEQNRDTPVPDWKQHRQRWCPGASELRESRKKTGGEGDGAVSGRLTWWCVLGVGLGGDSWVLGVGCGGPFLMAHCEEFE